jgi:hypothetical protein
MHDLNYMVATGQKTIAVNDVKMLNIIIYSFRIVTGLLLYESNVYRASPPDNRTPIIIQGFPSSKA